jgi:catechol 2,3-dioxygenase-like lactoylglutathione lyase family enzyme
MTLSLNHFTIRTFDMNATQAFYSKVLGLSAGPRPQFDFPGFWMYNGSHDNVANAVVHIVGMDKNDTVGLKNYLGERDVSALHGSGAVDHIAFFATGLQTMLQHLKSIGVPCRERTTPSIGLYQLFLDDPSGIVVELNYPAAEKAAMQAQSASQAR